MKDIRIEEVLNMNIAFFKNWIQSIIWKKEMGMKEKERNYCENTVTARIESMNPV